MRLYISLIFLLIRSVRSQISNPEPEPESEPETSSQSATETQLTELNKNYFAANPELFCGWTLWSGWSICDCQGRPCGEGVRTRRRQCYDENSLQQVDESNCDGAGLDSKVCQVPCPFWGNWAPWTTCSETCGEGTQMTSRKCFGGSPGDFGCEDETQKSQNCKIKECPYWSEWMAWCTCSKTCGDGRRTRQRKCLHGIIGQDCIGEHLEFSDCNDGPCPEWTSWSSWSSCSVTCGEGEITRTRTCTYNGIVGQDCIGSAIETKKCGQPCPFWTEWSSFTDCSEACGDGSMTRSRSCVHGIAGIDCPGFDSETENCNLGECPYWTDYIEQRKCVTDKPRCGPGKFKLERTCMHGVPGRSFPLGCPGSDTDYKPCHVGCDWTDWGEWNECSVKLGHGYQRRRRVCDGGFPGDIGCEGSDTESQKCTISDWGNWGRWSSCSVDCGQGKVTRNRVCRYGQAGIDCEGSETEEAVCTRCCWSDYGDWSECSVTAGSGFSTRFRNCTYSENDTCCLGSNKQVKRCYEPFWRNWSSWSNCDCGQSTQYRRRSCSVNSGCPDDGLSDYQEQDCFKPYWDQWSVWTCHAQKGRGSATRTRDCIQGKPGEGCCTGYNRETKPCVDPYWSDWTDWSRCSVNRCGKGSVFRTRQCLFGKVGIDCKGDTKETQACEKICNWRNWSSWSDCKVRTRSGIGEGNQYRNRVCNGGIKGDIGCKGDDQSSQKCVIDGWSNWSSWSDCSVKCGNGEITRTRQCLYGEVGKNNCLGNPEETKACVRPCWGPWSNFTECDADCGWGYKYQSRNCQFGNIGVLGCRGQSYYKEKCFSKPCLSNWSRWNRCEGFCDIGSQNRIRTCTGSDGKHSDLCQVDLGESRECDLNCPCKSWSAWGDFTKCPKCWDEEIWTLAGWRINPTPAMTRHRQCLGCKGNCEGPKSQTEQCPCDEPCSKWSNWSDWNGCPSCTDDLDTKFYRKKSRSCVGGRNCKGPNMTFLTHFLCPPCPVCSTWNEWSKFSSCPSCDDDQRTHYQTRTRTCNGIVGKGDCQGPAKEVQKCPKMKRCSYYTNWSDWKPCPTCTDSLTPVFTQRQRVCHGKKCLGPAEEAKICKIKQHCSVWVDWDEWSSCPECDDFGKQHRRMRERRCLGGNCMEVYGSDPGNFQVELCPELPRCSFWNKWSEWSDSCPYCRDTTKPELTHTKTRTRSCSGQNCIGSATETVACDITEPCARMSNWSEWEACPKCCFKNQEMPIVRRYKTCLIGDCPRSSDFQEKVCEIPYCEFEVCDDTRIAFVMDASKSISSNHFQQIKLFVQNVIQSANNLQPQKTYFSAMSFNSQMLRHFDFNSYQEEEILLEQIGQIDNNQLGSHIAEALAWSYENFMSPKLDWAHELPGRGIVVLISDGVSNPSDDSILAPVLELFQVSEIEIIAVGIGSQVDYQRLLKIASNQPEKVLKISSYNSLTMPGVTDQLVKKFCRNIYL